MSSVRIQCWISSVQIQCWISSVQIQCWSNIQCTNPMLIRYPVYKSKAGCTMYKSSAKFPVYKFKLNIQYTKPVLSDYSLQFLFQNRWTKSVILFDFHYNVKYHKFSKCHSRCKLYNQNDELIPVLLYFPEFLEIPSSVLPITI